MTGKNGAQKTKGNNNSFTAFVKLNIIIILPIFKKVRLSKWEENNFYYPLTYVR